MGEALPRIPWGYSPGHFPYAWHGDLRVGVTPEDYMANRRFESQFNYSFHAMPVALDCGFIVTPTNAAGVTSLVGPGIQKVWMHSSSPATGNNLASGQIQVFLQDNYYKYYGGSSQVAGPTTGSNILIASSSVLTIGVAYQITVLGTSTQANWEAVGVPAGVPAAVGVTFIASVTGSGTGTGAVKALASSGIYNIELLGDPAYTLQNSNPSANSGGILLFGCMGPTGAALTAPILVAPATGSLIRLRMHFSNSSVLVQGE